MAIKELSKALEFSYIPDKIENMVEGAEVVYNISYDPNVFGEIFPIKITIGSDEMKFTLEFFEQVVEFFIQKGLLKPKILAIKTPIEGSHFNSVISDVPLPVIQKKDSKASPLSDPLMTFDISAQENITVKEKPSVLNIETSSTISGPIVSNSIVDSEISKEDIKRPVIRTKIRGGDIRSAEKEAALLRGSPPQKKVIKKVAPKEE